MLKGQEDKVSQKQLRPLCWFGAEQRRLRGALIAAAAPQGEHSTEFCSLVATAGLKETAQAVGRIKQELEKDSAPEGGQTLELAVQGTGHSPSPSEFRKCLDSSLT